MTNGLSPSRNHSPSDVPKRKRYPYLLKGAAFLASYALGLSLFHLLALTIITYFMISGGAQPRFQEISDTYAANEIVLVSLASLIFVVLLRSLNPLTTTTTEQIFTWRRFMQRYVPGFLSGSVLASGIIGAFLMAGIYRYLGSYIQLEEATLTIANIALRILAVITLAYCDEFIFRSKALTYFRKHLRDLPASLLTAVLFSAIKMFQFDLGIAQVATLFLLGFALSIQACTDADFVRGAGFWSALLVVFHPLLSLPVFGNEVAGILILKYQPAQASTTLRVLSGGAGGPLSGLCIQILLLSFIARSVIRHKKVLLNTPAPWLR